MAVLANGHCPRVSPDDPLIRPRDRSLTARSRTPGDVSQSIVHGVRCVTDAAHNAHPFGQFLHSPTRAMRPCAGRPMWSRRCLPDGYQRLHPGPRARARLPRWSRNVPVDPCSPRAPLIRRCAAHHPARRFRRSGDRGARMKPARPVGGLRGQQSTLRLVGDSAASAGELVEQARVAEARSRIDLARELYERALQRMRRQRGRRTRRDRAALDGAARARGRRVGRRPRHPRRRARIGNGPRLGRRLRTSRRAPCRVLWESGDLAGAEDRSGARPRVGAPSG